MSGIALIDRDGSLTYDELEDRVARAAGALHEAGVAPGDHVLVVTGNEASSVIAYHAVIRCGGVAVLSGVSAGASELRAALDATSPVLAVVSPLATDVPTGLPVLPAAGLGASAEPLTAPVDPDPDAPRVVVFTSGTTSVPKGVVHTGRSLAATVACCTAMTGFSSTDRAFLVSPLASITGVTQALELAPTVGGTVVLESAYADDGTLDLLLATGGTFYGGPDLVLDRLLRAASRRGVAVPLRTAALGGTMLRAELIAAAEAAGIRVIRVYGSSEVPWSTGTRPTEPAELRLGDEGTPGPGVELRLADDGELLVRGPHRFLTYAGAHGAGDAWFATGDEAEIVDGRLRIVGRLKDVASRNGRKVSLAEVDAAFTAASGITGCAAFVVPDDETGERVAVAVASPGLLDVPAVLASMKGAGLASYKLPESVVAFDRELPATATGKVQRRDLSEADGVLLWQAERLRG